jgi:hypothetical protein
MSRVLNLLGEKCESRVVEGNYYYGPLVGVGRCSPM